MYVARCGNRATHGDLLRPLNLGLGLGLAASNLVRHSQGSCARDCGVLALMHEAREREMHLVLCFRGCSLSHFS